MPQINYTTKFNFRWKAGSENSAFFGAHFRGKTYAATNLIVRPLLGFYPQLIWDHNGKIFLELIKKPTSAEQASLIRNAAINHASQIKEDRKTYILKPKDKSMEHFLQFCDIITKRRQMHVTFDETHNYNTAHRLPDKFNQVIRDLGNVGISYTAIFQRPAENHKSLISNAKHRFLFGLSVPTDVQYLKSLIGMEAELFLPKGSPLRKMYKEEPQLPIRSFIYRNEEEEKPIVVVGGLK